MSEHAAFDLGADETRVRSRLDIRRNPAAAQLAAALHLDGEAVDLVALALDGEPLGANRYQLPPEGGLILGDVPDAFTIALVRSVQDRGAMPYVNLQRARITRELLKGATTEQYATTAEVELQRMQKMQAYIAVRGSENIFETSDVPADRVQTVAKVLKPVLDHRVNKTKWVVLRWPSSAMAQQAGMSTQAFEDFYFEVCTFDYRRYGPGMKALADLMNKTDRVHLKGPGTDLKFSIKSIGAVPCGGLRNIPDELLEAPHGSPTLRGEGQVERV